MRPQPECPECEKLLAVSEESNKIGDFISWLKREKGVVLCELIPDEEQDECPFMISRYNHDSAWNALFAEYYEIDLDKVEKERKALLEWVREQY